jgi:ADP-heptose:LPS heptosyltransferase
VRALRARWPEARVAACVAPDAAPVAGLLPGVDEVVPFRGGIAATARALATPRPDLALVPDRSLRARLLARLSGARRRVGPGSGARGEPLLDRALRAAGRAGAPSSDRLLRLDPPPGLARGTGGALVVLVPGGPAPTVRWGIEKFALAADSFGRAGANVAVVGQTADGPLAARVAELSDLPILDLTGLPPAERVAALASAAMVMGGDVPLVHQGRALGRPTVILFGPTDPGRHAFGPADLPIRLGIECQPCAEGAPPRCPLGHLRCLTALAAQPVVEAAAAILGPSGGRA